MRHGLMGDYSINFALCIFLFLLFKVAHNFCCICLQNHASIISFENGRISDFLSTLHPVNTRMDTVHFDFMVTCFCRLKWWRNLLNEVWKKGCIICRVKDFNTQLADLFDLVSFTSNALSECTAQHQLPNVHHNPVHTCTNAPNSQW